MNFNKSTLVGRLVENVRFTAGDASKSIDDRAWGRIAVNRSSAKDSPYDVFNFVVWGMLAALLRDHSMKGKELLLEGKLRTNNKKRPDNTYDNYIELVAETVQLGHDPQNVREEKKEPAAKTPEELLASMTQGTDINIEQLTAMVAGAILSKRGRAAQEQQAPGEPPEGSYSSDFPM